MVIDKNGTQYRVQWLNFYERILENKVALEAWD